MKRLKKALALALFATVLGISGTIAGSSWTQNAFAKETQCEEDVCNLDSGDCEAVGGAQYDCSESTDGCSSSGC